MTPTELKAKFEVTGKTARDFIRWAAGHGIRFDDAEVSDWQSGKRRMTKTCQLCFINYFESIMGNKPEVPKRAADSIAIVLDKVPLRQLDALIKMRKEIACADPEPPQKDSMIEGINYRIKWLLGV